MISTVGYYVALVFWIVTLRWLMRVPKPYEANIMGRIGDRSAWRYSIPIGTSCMLGLAGFPVWSLGSQMKGVSPSEVSPPGTPCALIFTALALAPLLEEMLFRGLLFLRLRRTKLGLVPAMLVSSGIFCLLHGDPIQTFFFALVLCLLVYRTDNAWPGVFLHFLFNLLALTPRLFWRQIPDAVLTNLQVVGGTMFLLSCPGFVILFRDCYRIWQEKNNERKPAT